MREDQTRFTKAYIMTAYPFQYQIRYRGRTQDICYRMIVKGFPLDITLCTCLLWDAGMGISPRTLALYK